MAAEPGRARGDRLGDDVGSVLYVAADDSGAGAVTGYARTAAQRLRTVAGG